MHFSSSDILPSPFRWIEIPAGEVKLIIDGNWQRMFHPDYRPDFATQVCQVSAFEIAKYPVTNAQFARFIAVAGMTSASGGQTTAGTKSGSIAAENQPIGGIPNGTNRIIPWSESPGTKRLPTAGG